MPTYLIAGHQNADKHGERESGEELHISNWTDTAESCERCGCGCRSVGPAPIRSSFISLNRDEAPPL